MSAAAQHRPGAHDGLAAAARTHRDRLVTCAERIATTQSPHDVDGEVADGIVGGPTVGTLALEVGLGTGPVVIGDVVVTTATATVRGHLGWSCVMGADAQAATAAAICDAALGAGHPAGPEVAALVRAALSEEQRDRDADLARAAATRLVSS